MIDAYNLLNWVSLRDSDSAVVTFHAQFETLDRVCAGICPTEQMFASTPF